MESAASAASNARRPADPLEDNSPNGTCFCLCDIVSPSSTRFVKDRRPSISPNFNFLGQLLEFEKDLQLLQVLTSSTSSSDDDKTPDKQNSQEVNGVNGLSAEVNGRHVEPHAPPEPKLPSPSSLQQGFNGLHLSAERILDTNRLKRSFSLDIKSVYAPNGVPHCPTLAPAHSEDVPKLFKLDSPGTGAASNGVCSPSPLLDSPASSSESPFPSPSSGGSLRLAVGSSSSASRPRRKPKHGAAASSPIHAHHHPHPPQTLSLSLDSKSPSLDDGPKGSLLLSLPSLPTVGSGAMWTKHRDTVQATTPVTPTADVPWHFGLEEVAERAMDLGGAGAGGLRDGEEPLLRFGCSSAYVAFGCSESARLQDKVQREKPPTQRDHRDSKPSSGGGNTSGSGVATTADKQYKRRSCQMEFEEGISESRSREELGKIGKQSSFSGSMEIIEVS